MPAPIARRAPAQRLAGLSSHRGPVKPIPRAAAKRKDCCDKPEYENIDGSKICVNCGTQISESNIVAEVTFGETSTGAATVQGGFVGETARHARTLGAAAGRRLGSGFQSREETEQNGRQELRQLCPLLHIPPNVEDIAFNLWKLAAAQNFIQGRRTSEVAGCCLYAACRRDRHNTILLMDISEALQVNVFKLGDVYKELSKSLYLEVHSFVQPIVEVEPLLMKYCNKLEFGERTRQVAEDAARIIKRMKRDWMVSGRHPAGLCGACIILAARMNNFRRTVREVVYVVKVADMTIASRLAEFKKTKSSTLTVEDFRKKGLKLKHQHDPPSYYAAEERAKRMEQQKRKRVAREEERRTIDIPDDESVASSRMSTLTPSPAPEQATQQTSADVPAAKKRRKSLDTGDSAPQPSADVVSSTESQAPTTQEPVPALRRDADGFAIPDLPIDPALRQTHPGNRQSPSESSERAQARVSASPTPGAEGDVMKKRKKTPKSTPPAVVLTDADFAAEDILQDEIENILQDRECISSRNDTERDKLDERAKAVAEQQRALVTAAARTKLEEQGKQLRVVSDSEIIGEDEFADDPEVMNALLSEEQVRVKEMIWVAHNEDWLRAQQAKHLKRALDEAEGKGTDKRQIKRRKRSRMGDGTVLTEGGTPVQSPADAATRMLDKRAPKNWSKSVDYAALNRILAKNSTPNDSQGSEASTPAASVNESREASPAASEVSRSGHLPTPPATQAGDVTTATAAAAAAAAKIPAPETSASTDQQPAEVNVAEAKERDGADADACEDGAAADEEDEEDEEDEDDTWAGASPEHDYDDEEDDFGAAVGELTGSFGAFGDDEEID